jgi:hypothetical protein
MTKFARHVGRPSSFPIWPSRNMITLSSLVREIGVESRARSTVPDNGLPDQKAAESGASWNSEAVRVLRVQEESSAPQIAVLQDNGDPVLASGITSRRTIAVLVMQRPRWIKATSLHGAGAPKSGVARS